MKYKNLLLLALAVITFATPAVAEDDNQKLRESNNQIYYGELAPGISKRLFDELYPGFKETKSGKWAELAHKSITDKSVYVITPSGMNLSNRYLKMLPISITTKEQKCDSPVAANFISMPKRKGRRQRHVLYLYGYLICGGEGMISKERLLDKYMEKYGSYTTKDYDRNRIVYEKAEKRFVVGVSPVDVTINQPAPEATATATATAAEKAAATTAKTVAGLIVYVEDRAVLKKVYLAWRGHIRRLEEEAKQKF